MSEGESGRAGACCRKSQAGRGAKLGRARCVRGMKEKGRAVQLRASAGRGKKEKARPEPGVGPEWKKVIFFSKTKPFPNLFSLFSILSQLQIKFEFNFKSSSPTLNQKQYASA